MSATFLAVSVAVDRAELPRAAPGCTAPLCEASVDGGQEKNRVFYKL